MNISPFRPITLYDNSETKATFPLPSESMSSSSSLNSFNSNQLSNHINISTGNQTYNIRKLKSLAISCNISQTPLFEKVLLTLDLISTDLSDSALLDFCEFFSFCYRIVPREVISRIISVFQNQRFSANSLIVISYIIKDFQDKPYDENSIQFFQSFIIESFSQLRKVLLSSSTNNSNNTNAPNSLNNSNSFNFKKFSNCLSFLFVNLQNPETFINPEDDFEFTNVDETLFLDNNNYNEYILSENDENSNLHNSSNNNSNCSIPQTDAQDNSFLDTNNDETNSNDPNGQKTYKIFNCEFTHEKILRFLLYLLRSKAMREDSSMRGSWIDFADLLASQYESQTELAQFADYMISIGKIDMVPKAMFINHDFFELAKKENIIEVLQILSIDDLNNNYLLFASILNHFNDSEFATTFLKRCQVLDYTLPPFFLKEIVYTNEESSLNGSNHDINDEYILSEIINRINPNEFNENLLYYLTRYKFKLNPILTRKIPSILGADLNNSPIISFECLLQVMESPLKYIEYDYLIPFIYNCTNIDVFNSLTNNYPHNNNIVNHPLFRDPKFWSQLISLFEFNSIQHFSRIFIANNSENARGPLIARIFLEDFPNNMKSSFYYFAKTALSGNRDSFSTCKETRELLSRFAYFYPRQFWRLFSKTNLIIEFTRSLQGRFTYNYMILALSLVQINLCEENGIALGDPHIKEFYLPTPPTTNLIEEIIKYFQTNDNFFKFENTSNEAIQVLSVGHYYFSALIFHYKPFTINGYNPLYCLILFIIVINDLKYFKKAGFQQNKKIINSLLNNSRNMSNIRQVFEMDFNGKEQLIDVFLSSFGANDDEYYVLNNNDDDLKWVRFVFDNNSFLLPNLAYSNSLAYFFGQLTLCVNAFNCPNTSKFILSKINYLLQLFYVYPCPFFIINSEYLDNFISHQMLAEKINFQLINFIMSSFAPLGKCLSIPDLDLNSMVIPFIKQNQVSEITTVFDFCHRYLTPDSIIKLFKIPNLPIEIRAKYSFVFKYLTDEETKEIFTIDTIKYLVHTTKSSSFGGIVRSIEAVLDDNETLSNRSTFITQMKKIVFSCGEDFRFPSRLSLKIGNDPTESNTFYNLNFIKGLYRVYEDSFVDYNSHILIERMNFIPLNPNSEYSNYFLNELIKDAIQTNSWQMFTVLKNIANSHLFIFSNNDNQIDLIDLFKYCIETINLVNLNNLNDQFKLFIACHAFLSFLILSPCIADAFFNWIFSKFGELNDNEFYYILTFIDTYLKNDATEIQMLAFCVKYNFVSMMINYFQNSIQNGDENPEQKMPLNNDHQAENPASTSTSTSTSSSSTSTSSVQNPRNSRNRPDGDFNDRMLYIDYDLFTVSDSDDNNSNDHDSDENIDSYMNAIHLNPDSSENLSNNQPPPPPPSIQFSSPKPKKSESMDKINMEGLITNPEKIKKQSYSLGLSIIETIELNLSKFYDKTFNLKFIKFEEILKNSGPYPLYSGSYNNCWHLYSFRPFSNSFPRQIAIPSLLPKSFSPYLADLKSSLANVDIVDNIIKSKLMGEVDSQEIVIKIANLRDPYEKESANFNSPIEPKEKETNSSSNFSSLLQWGEPSNSTTTTTTTTSSGGQPLLLKDIISIDQDEFDFLDEGGQAALLRQNLPPIPNINDPIVHRLLLKMPNWARTILSNSLDRAILPPCYLIELYRIITIINSSMKKLKRKKYEFEVNPNQFFYELESKDEMTELKINFIANLTQSKKHISLKNIKKICQALLTNSTTHNEQITKKVFLLGNKYISINSNIGTLICILSAFESIKSSEFYAVSFSSFSALHIYEELGRSCISNSDIAILACSLFSGLGNSISDIGIQFFETCLEMNDSKIYECLDYIAQLPEKVRQRLTDNICNLIDNKELIEDLKKIINDPSTFMPKNESQNKNNILTLIEKVVKNFQPIVKMRSTRFYEILTCILSKGKYLSVVGQIANILCPPKIPQNKLRLSSQSSSSSSTSSSSSSVHMASQPPLLPTPMIMTPSSSLSIGPRIQPPIFQPQIPQTQIMQQQQQQQQQNPLRSTNLSISLNDQDDDYTLLFGVPNYIYKTSPEFWKVIGPNMPLFNKMIESDLKTLQSELSFLKIYPEVLSFNCKLLLFHKIQCMQQTKQQRQLQKEYHKRGGILAFNSVIMTINNSNNNSNTNNNNNNNNSGNGSSSASTNSISFINGSSPQQIQPARSNPRAIATGSSAMISFVNEQHRTQSMPASSLMHHSSLQTQGSQTIFSINDPPQPPPITPITTDRTQRRMNSSSRSNNSTNNNNNNGGGGEEGRSNTTSINGGIIRPMIKVRRSHVLADTYSVFGPAFSELGFSIMPVRDIFVRFTGEPGIDLGGLTKDWISSTIKEIFNQDYYLFKQTTDGFSLFPNPSSSVNPEHLGYFELAGRIIAISLAKDITIDAHLALPFLKNLLEKKINIRDLERVDNQIYNSLKWVLTSENVEDLDMYFVVDIERSVDSKETVDLIENGRNIKVTENNKKFFVASMANFYLHSSIENQTKAFKKGFYSIIPHSLIEMFTPTELDLLISGTNEIDVNDMKKNCSYEKPYTKNHPVVKLFFDCISKWNQEELHLLLRFITGLAHMPIGGFASMAEKKKPLTISPGGDRERLPQAHTCFNRIDIPAYENESELNEKLHYSIYECDNFLLI